MRRIVLNLIAIVVLVAGLRWMLVGANFILGSAMSGKPEWLYIGLACVIASLVLAWWTNFRRARRPGA